MKTMKKVLSIALALLLIAALAVPALAVAEDGNWDDKNVEITFTKPEGVDVTPTYELYKVFDVTAIEDGTVDLTTGEPVESGLSYTWTNSGNYLNGSELYNLFDVTKVSDSLWVVNGVKDGFDAEEFATKYVARAKTIAAGQGDPWTVAGEGPFEVDAGYYVIASSLGNKMIVDTIGKKEVTITEKNVLPTVEKKVVVGTERKDSVIAEIGEEVTFSVKVDLGQGVAINGAKLTDTMSGGLMHTDVTSVNLYVEDANGNVVEGYPKDLLNATGNEPKVTPVGQTSNKERVFTLSFPGEAEGYTGPEGAKRYIVFEYRGKLSTDTVTGNTGNTNEAKFEYGIENEFSTKPDSATVYTYDLYVKKHNSSDELLDGAVFALRNSDGKYYKWGSTPSNANDLWVDWVALDECDKVTSSATATGTFEEKEYNLSFKGLKDGTYYLEEIEAPAGYNKLAQPITITIVDGNVYQTVENLSGSELPSTGGIGTTIFYIVGGLLVAGAAVLLVTKKRVQA